ncbi:hypothetical protein LTR33_018611, partial [Friedmanniomyces endolithicus]
TPWDHDYSSYDTADYPLTIALSRTVSKLPALQLTMADTADTSTTTGIDYHCDQARELRQALDKVLAYQETLKDKIPWPTMDCKERFKPEEIGRLKSLIGDIEELEKVSQRLLPPPTALRMIKESSDRGKAAAKAFKLPEVLEEILLH